MPAFLRRCRTNTLLHSLAAYGVGEIASRLARIGAIVAIARQISPAAMGVAALAISLFELIRVLANAGIGQSIIVAPEAELAGTCRTANRLFWAWCASVACIQLVVAALLAWAFGQPEAGALLALLSAVYLLMPLGLVQVFLLMRAGRLTTTARIATTQTITEHLLSMLLVLAWPSPAALVIPKLMTVPVWLIGVRRAMTWRPDPAAPAVPVARFVRYGSGILGTEIATAARGQLDKLIVGALLGTQALGGWFFAFGAGLGITNSVVGALSIVLLPHLSGAINTAERARRVRAALKLAGAVLVPLTLMQVALAPLYVPILFGARWADHAFLVSLLGLGALPTILAAVATAKLRATGNTALDAAIGSAATISALAGLLVGTRFGLAGAATGYVVGLWLVLIPAALFALRNPASSTLKLKEFFA